jgi:hypothetical protein
MAWQDWFELQVIQRICRHASGNVIAILSFALTAIVAKQVISDPGVIKSIEQVENVVLVGLVALFGIDLGLFVIKGIWRQFSGAQILAF